MNDLLPEIQVIWINRYACGNDGGWLNRSVESDGELHDLVWLEGVKVKLKKKDRNQRIINPKNRQNAVINCLKSVNHCVRLS